MRIDSLLYKFLEKQFFRYIFFKGYEFRLYNISYFHKLNFKKFSETFSDCILLG